MVVSAFISFFLFLIFIIFTQGFELEAFDGNQMKLTDRLNLGHDVIAIAWSADGTRFAALSDFGAKITVWDSKTWDVIKEINKYGGLNIKCSFFFITNDSLIIGAPFGRSHFEPYEDLASHTFEIVDLSSKAVSKFTTDDGDQNNFQHAMLYFDCKNHLCGGVPNGKRSSLFVYSIPNFSKPNRIDFDLKKDSIKSVSFCSYSSKGAVGTLGGSIIQFEENQSKNNQIKVFDHEFAVESLSFDKKCNYIIAGASRVFGIQSKSVNSLAFIDTNSDTVSYSDDIINANINYIDTGPPNVFVVAANIGLFLGNFETKKLRVLQSTEGLGFQNAKFSKDGRIAASIGKSVLIFSTKTPI